MVSRAGPAWARVALRAGLVASRVSRRLGVGAGSIIGGRVTLLLDPGALSGLAAGRRVVLVSGTNGKTTTSHLLAAALRTAGPVAHNATGSNMADGAVAALAAARDAEYAVLEVDEWHLTAVARAVQPAVVVLLNLTRDQLDRGTEVRAVAAAVAAALTRLPRTLVVANADDPMVVWAASRAPRVCWVAAGAGWLGDTATCPRCGSMMHTDGPAWHCGCGLARPEADWWLDGDLLYTRQQVTRLALRLPGRCNIGNAAQAVAAAAALGVQPAQGVPTEIVTITADSTPPAGCDVYLLGGGEDIAQLFAADWLRRHRDLHHALDSSARVLAVCAGLQVLGHTMRDRAGQDHPGLGVLDVTTTPGRRRAVGEITTTCAIPGVGQLTGFETTTASPPSAPAPPRWAP